MITSKAALIVASYEDRTRFARAETKAVRHPHWLPSLLNSSTSVAEIPCGTGHFLDDYLDAGVAVTLVDASPAMLAAAIEHASETGLDTTRTFPVLSYIEELGPLRDVDLVVIPNAALNQLACQTPLTDLLTSLRASLNVDTSVLAQVVCTHPPDGADTATFYDPARPHGTWFTDRQLNPHAGGAAVRQRRQYRDKERLRIQFDYHDSTGTSLHTTTVELSLFSSPQLIEAFHAAGFSHVRVRPGHDTLSEVSARAKEFQR